MDYNLLESLQPPNPANVPILHKETLNNPDDYDETVERMFERPWIQHYAATSSQSYAPSANMANYGQFMSDDVGIAALMLHLNFTNQEKETLLIRFVQLGIDLYGIVQDRHSSFPNWQANGGHSSGRKWPILFAGLMFDDSDMKNIGAKSGDYAYDGDGKLKKPDYIYFGEDDQTFYVSSDDIYSQPYTLSGQDLFPPGGTTQGNVKVVNGSNIVEGVGTNWDLLSGARYFGVVNDAEAYKVDGKTYWIASINMI